MDILEVRRGKKEPVQWGRKQYLPCRSSIHHAHKACKYRLYRVIKPGCGVRRASETAATHSASQESSSQLKKHPLMKNFTRKADHIKATQKPQIL